MSIKIIILLAIILRLLYKLKQIENIVYDNQGKNKIEKIKKIISTL